MGGLGLRSQPAFWAIWADCLVMIRARHLDVAAKILRQGLDVSPTRQAAESVAKRLFGVERFEPLSWEALAIG